MTKESPEPICPDPPTTRADIRRALGKLEGQMQGIHDTLERIELGVYEKIDHHDHRLRDVEKRISKNDGTLRAIFFGTPVIGGIVAALVAWFSKSPPT